MEQPPIHRRFFSLSERQMDTEKMTLTCWQTQLIRRRLTEQQKSLRLSTGPLSSNCAEVQILRTGRNYTVTPPLLNNK